MESIATPDSSKVDTDSKVLIMVNQRIDRERKLRILMAKVGLDGHDRGVKIISRAYRDAGFEVIYSGLHQTPEQIANAAIQEDVDLIGLSCLSGAHIHLFSEVVRQLKERGGHNITIIGGGIIPQEDIPKLEEAGIKKIFPPGTSTIEIVEWTKREVKPLD